MRLIVGGKGCSIGLVGGKLGSFAPRLGIPMFGSDFWDPIVSGILIPFLIPKIPFGKYFLNSNVWSVRKLEFRFQNSEFWYLIRKQILIPP
jgi:hypothetical protein